MLYTSTEKAVPKKKAVGRARHAGYAILDEPLERGSKAKVRLESHLNKRKYTKQFENKTQHSCLRERDFVT